MLILSGLIAMVAVGVVLVRFSDDWGGRNLAGIMLSSLAGAGLLVALIALSVERLSTHGGVVRLHSVRATLEAARARGESVENAAFQVKIAEANQWLASKQYWNGTAFDIWIPDAVDSLRPIR